MGKFLRDLSSLAKTTLPILLLFYFLYLFTRVSIPPSTISSPRSQSPISISKEHSTPLPLFPQTPPSISKELDNELEFDFAPYVKLYKSGRVERLHGTDMVLAGLDRVTGVISKDVVIDPASGLSVRLYLPRHASRSGKKKAKLPVLLYFHGGAFVIESAFSPFYHHYLNVLVSKAKIVAVSVDYRLAPENRLPAAYDDAWMALIWATLNTQSGPEPWLADHGDVNRIFLGGDSAGGNIAHNAVIRAGKEGLPGFSLKGLVLQNPYFWGKDPVGTEPGDGFIREGLEKSWDFVCGGSMGIDHPAVNPLASLEDLSHLGCERVMVTVAGRDFFRERGVAYVRALEMSGWGDRVEMYETRDEFHVYFIPNPTGDNAVKEMKAVAAFLNRE